MFCPDGGTAFDTAIEALRGADVGGVASYTAGGDGGVIDVWKQPDMLAADKLKPRVIVLPFVYAAGHNFQHVRVAWERGERRRGERKRGREGRGSGGRGREWRARRGVCLLCSLVAFTFRLPNFLFIFHSLFSLHLFLVVPAFLPLSLPTTGLQRCGDVRTALRQRRGRRDSGGAAGDRPRAPSRPDTPRHGPPNPSRGIN